MLLLRPASKLTVMIDGDQICEHRRLYKEFLNVLFRNEVTGIAAHKRIGSLGRSRVQHSVKNEAGALSLPCIVEAVDSARKKENVFADLAEILAGSGLIQIQNTLIRDHETQSIGKLRSCEETQVRSEPK